MRKFVAGLCCIIVGMQVLVGVPLVVCLAFYAMTQGGGPVAFEVHTNGDFPATIAPPNFSNPPPFLPNPPTAALPAPQIPPLLPPTLPLPKVAASEHSPSVVEDRINSPTDAAISQRRRFR